MQAALTQFPTTSVKKIGKTEEQSQKAEFKDAKLQHIFEFIARVKQENPSVQVGQLRVSRPNRPSAQGGDEDKWALSVTFFLYSTASGAPGPAQKVDSKVEEAPPEETQPEEKGEAEKATDGPEK